MNAWAAWEDANDDGVIHLRNQNQNPLGTPQFYETVDYLVTESITFGDGNAEADLVIDAGVTVWFSLETDNEFINGDGEIEGDGNVDGVCTFTFNDEVTFICGTAGQANVTLEPWPFLGGFLNDYDNYPVFLPGVTEEIGFWAEAENRPAGNSGTFFAGGFILNNGEATTITNTTVSNFIGGPLETAVNAPWYSWTVGVNGVAVEGDDCFGIKILADDSDLAMTGVTMTRSTFNGICVIADGTNLTLNTSTISSSWILGCDDQGQNRFHPPDAEIGDPDDEGDLPERVLSLEPTTGNAVLYTGNDGVFIIDNADITLGSLRGIVLQGDRCQNIIRNTSRIGFANNGNGRHRDDIRAAVNVGLFWNENPNDNEFWEGLDFGLAGIWLGGVDEEADLSLTINNSQVDANRRGILFEENPHFATITNGSTVSNNIGNHGQGDGITLSSGDNTLVITSSSIENNLSDGIEIITGANDIDISDGVAIDDNTQDGIRINSDQNDIDIATGTTINDNFAGIRIRSESNNNDIDVTTNCQINSNSRGFWISGDTNTITVSDNCEIDENSKGIYIESSNNTIDVTNSSTINNNNIYGVEYRGESANNMISQNSFELSATSQINLNNRDGIHLGQLELSTIDIINSEIRENEYSGIWGGYLYTSTITANNSHIDDNDYCGIWLDWDGAVVGPKNRPEGGAYWCEDDEIIIENTSTVSDNLCEGDEAGTRYQAGILAQGFGHSITIENSEVLDNLDCGVKCQVVDWCRATVTNSDINSNFKTGLDLMSPRELTVENSNINFNGEDDGENTFGLGIDVNYYAISTRGEDDPDPPTGPELVVNLNSGSTFEDNNNSGVWINGDMWDIAYQGDQPEDWVQPICTVSIDDCVIQNNDSHGLVLKELYDAECLINETPITGQDGGYGLWIHTLRSQLFINGDDPLLGSDVYVTQCDISGNDIGVFFGHTLNNVPGAPNNAWQIGPYVSIEGCSITDNRIGLRGYQYFSLGLVLKPLVLGNGDIVLTTFHNNTEYSLSVDPKLGVNAAQRAERANALLIDAVLFDGEDVGGETRPEHSHIQLRGQFKGWLPDDDRLEPTADFATIRKCKITEADGDDDGENIKGIHMVSISQQFGEVVSVHNPLVDIRNNYFFENSTSVEVDYDEIILDDTWIYNNTILGDDEDENDIGIDILTFDGAQDAAMGDFLIGSNSYEFLNTGIFQRLNLDPGPSYPCSNFHEVTTNGENCNGTEQGEDRWYADAPLHLAGVTEPERLLWSSPLINHGCPNRVDSSLVEGADTPEDPEDDLWYLTRTDIGCTGGGVSAGILDHNHFNVFDDVDITEDVTLESDDYEVINNLTVTSNDVLTINDNTSFWIHESDYIKVYGGLDANGWVGGERLIRFQGFPEEDLWDDIYFYNPNEDVSFDGCEIIGADYGIHPYNPNAGDAPVVGITNSVIRNCDWGMWISGNVQVLCENTQIIDNDNYGVYFYNNTPAFATEFTAATISSNGLGDYDAGVKAFRANAIFNACEISLNSGYGFYLYDDGDIGLNNDPEGGLPNLVFNNGQGANQDHDYRGAEFRLRNGSYPTFGPTNLWDIIGANPDGEHEGKFVSKDENTNANAVTINGSYLGEGWHGADAWAAGMVADHFYWGNGTAITVANVSADYLDGGLIVPDSFDDFLLAESYRNRGMLSEAIESYWDYISAGEYEATKQRALLQMQACYVALNRDFDQMVRRCRELSEDYEEENAGFSWAAKKRVCEAVLYGEGPEEAIEEYRSIIDDAPFPSDSLLVEMDILYVEQMYDDHVDATGNFAARLSAIEELLETIDENVEIKDNSLPTEFALHSAYPNPFNATTTIGFSLPEQMQVSLQLFDLTGRLMETLIDDRLEAGRFDAVWNGDMQAAGVYFYKLQAGDFVQTRKLMLVK